MATLHFNNAYLTVGGTDLSDHVRAVTINYTADELDDTAMGDSSRSRIGGLKDWSITVEFNQDYAAGEVDATLFSLVGTSAAIVCNPNSSTTSTSNPRYSGNVLVTEYTPIDGSVGDLATTSVTWPGNGALSRATA